MSYPPAEGKEKKKSVCFFSHQQSYAGSKLVQDQRAPNNGRHIGTIDVLILRCGPVRRSSSISGSTLNATSHPSSTTSRYPDGSPLHSVLGAPRWEKARMPKYSNLRSFGVDGTCDDRNPMETIGKKQKWGIKIVSKTKGTYGPLDEDTSDEGDVGRIRLPQLSLSLH